MRAPSVRRWLSARLLVRCSVKGGIVPTTRTPLAIGIIPSRRDSGYVAGKGVVGVVCGSWLAYTSRYRRIGVAMWGE